MDDVDCTLPNIIGQSGDELSSRQHARALIRVGSRKSQLAMVQTNWVIDRLRAFHPALRFEVITLDTIGDNILDKPLSKIGEKALFTRELEDELLAGNVDMIVHSLKDMPTTLPAQCCIGAITEREDPTDALVLRADLATISNRKLDAILANPNVKTFGTSSLRRIAQLRARKFDVAVRDIRGNLNTRLRKLDDHETFDFDCLILATAGLIRNGERDRISERLDEEWYHAVSQGALGIECRTNDTFMHEHVLGRLIDRRAMLECTAERVLMKCLEGGCSVPIGVRTSWLDHDETLRLDAIVLSLDGTRRVEANADRRLNSLQPEPDSVSCDRWSIDDFAYTIVEHLSKEDQCRMRNCVLLGRELAAKMIDLGVRDILCKIQKDKQS